MSSLLFQSLKHSQSGTYVPSRVSITSIQWYIHVYKFPIIILSSIIYQLQKERAQLIEAHYETDPDVRDLSFDVVCPVILVPLPADLCL